MERVGTTLSRWQNGPIFEPKVHVRKVPNMRNVVMEIKTQFPQAAINGDKKDIDLDSKEAWEFTDRVVQKLHSMDPNFGYVLHGDNEEVGDGAATYWLVGGAPVNNNVNKRDETRWISFKWRRGRNVFTWQDRASNIDNAHKWNLEHTWVYPRPGAPNYGYDPKHPGPVVGSTDSPRKPSSDDCVTSTVSDGLSHGLSQTYCGDIKSIESRCAVYQGESGVSCKVGSFDPGPSDTPEKHIWLCRDKMHCHGDACHPPGSPHIKNCDGERVLCEMPRKSTTPTSPTTPTAPVAPTAGIDCRELRIQIPELQRQLDEQLKAYSRGGGRLKRWLGFKRGSCENVQLCETLANAIHLAQSNPSMGGRMDSYKKRFRKNCKHFDRCRGIASAITQIRTDLNQSIQTYNGNCPVECRIGVLDKGEQPFSIRFGFERPEVGVRFGFETAGGEGGEGGGVEGRRLDVEGESVVGDEAVEPDADAGELPAVPPEAQGVPLGLQDDAEAALDDADGEPLEPQDIGAPTRRTRSGARWGRR